MALIKTFTAAGTAVTDEKIVCDESEVIDTITYYKGYLNYICNDNVEGNTSATYGVWTATSKGGTRKEVLVGGLPASTDQVAIDTETGVMYAYASCTLYVRYLAHGPIRRGVSGGVFPIPYLLTDGEAMTLVQYAPAYFQRIAYVEAYIYGDAPTSNTTITLKNAATGGDEETIVITSGDTTPGPYELTDPLKITTSQSLYVTVDDGNDINGLYLILRDL